MRIFAGMALVIGICLGVWTNQPHAQASDDANGGDISFQVKSLLAHRCIACHSGDDAKGKLILISRDAMLTGGQSGPGLVERHPEKSLVWEYVDQDIMPPKHPLSADEKRLIQDWIAAGAVWSGGAIDPFAISSDHRAGLDWWSLQTLQRVAVPTARDGTDVRQPIDNFIVQKLTQRGLSMSPAAVPRTLIRRVTFDLLGLPPTPDEIEQFLADERPDAWERLLDRLLASPHYGERWARHWLDVVRFGESNGFERDLPRPNAWHYRDWVIAALNRDMPYDEFARWQLAGDLLASNDLDALKATGFLVAGAHDTVIPVIDRMRATMRQDELEDIIGTVGQTFLGLTVNCARCHDHKFDPISTREYYQLASALAGIDHGEREFTPNAVTTQLAAWRQQIDTLSETLRQQEHEIRKALADRSESPNEPTSTQVPAAIAAWDFTQSLRDQIGEMHVKLMGAATQTTAGLTVNESSFAKTTRLSKEIFEKTLEVRVQLNSLQQSGGGVITLQTLNGNTFDAVVYAEQKPLQWMAGSEGFARTVSFEGPAEKHADNASVVLTQVYHADGTIVCYRNGQHYGSPIHKNVAVKFHPSNSQILFGLRHGQEPSDDRSLRGTIVAARLFNQALTAEQVALSADSLRTLVSETEIQQALSPDMRDDRRAKQSELNQRQQQFTQLQKHGTIQVYTAVATQPGPMRIHTRGSVATLGDEVAPGGLAAIRGLSSDFGLRPDAIESHRREQLANWITDHRNPLFARVMANRVWHYHFGSGLADSPNDMGFHAGVPSHPELLEWLAAEFQGRRRNQIEHDPAQPPDPQAFSLKRLHRLLLASATFRQGSNHNSRAAGVDANNRLLWRFSPRRLEAEEMRDAMLSVAGELNSQLGGKGYQDVNSYFFKGTQFYDPIDPVGAVNHRRTIYRMWARGGRSPFLDTFDCPDPSTTTPRRSSTVTPLQALSLLNHSFGLRMANHFANRLTAEHAASTDGQVHSAYLLLFGREADAEEKSIGQTFIARHGLPAYCRAMWNASEFLFLD
ncbi:DUF1549 domain-containing protein [Schlesneria paludicola]|uniref:DUF1549 domain-containing protein n=1 Tax=Schlesneria paludicola TaxID=360056 RepID=UPI00029AB987|nr:DUF1549 domain-containing protein [Schlesneria paludicola]